MTLKDIRRQVLTLLVLGISGATPVAAQQISGTDPDSPWSYQEDPRTSHPQQFRGEKWTPEQFSGLNKSVMGMIGTWFARDILRSQTSSTGGTPILVVGPNFYHLSDLDRRRVTDTFGQFYARAGGAGYGYMLRDWKTGEFIGSYTRQGLDLY